jgi:hypothetical protein
MNKITVQEVLAVVLDMLKVASPGRVSGMI